MKKRIDKLNKGVSPVIATVLLVLIVVIIAIIILVWYTAFRGEAVVKKIGNVEKRAEIYCNQIQLEGYENNDGTYGIKNKGNVPVYGYKLLLAENSNGKVSTEIKKGKEYAINPGGAKMLDITGTYEEIKLIPILLGKSQSKNTNQEFQCPETSTITIKTL